MQLQLPTSQPVALDLFCGGGGATRGLQLAGFYVVGVDIKQQIQKRAHYCGDQFFKTDALDFVDRHGWRFDFIWASPPCQGYSGYVTSRSSEHSLTKGKDEPRLIEPIREQFQRLGIPAVIENVVGARHHMRSDLRLCGSMFGLPYTRHRLFELHHFTAPEPETNSLHQSRKCCYLAKSYAAQRGWDYREMSIGGKPQSSQTVHRWRELLQVDWPANTRQLAEMIPPAYSEYISNYYLTRGSI
jgi:site-specific DNA-cytosine methylase